MPRWASMTACALQLCGFLVLGSKAEAQDATSVRHLVQALQSSKTAAELEKKVGADVAATLLDRPELLNKVLQGNGLRFLKALNIEFKSFRASDRDSLLGIGVSYDYSSDLIKTFIDDQLAHQYGMSLSAKATGNVAFDKSTNPNDFLDTSVSFHLFGSWGGVKTTDDAQRDRLNGLEDKMVKAEDPSAIYQELLGIVQKSLSTQFYGDVSFAAGLESNQDFTAKQFVYGAHSGFDLKPWGSGYWDVLDWPFAAVRWLSGFDDVLKPRGSAFPTVLVGIDRIHPTGDDPREAAGEAGDFTRFRSELAFRTPVGKGAYVEADVRYYKELGASSSVRAADLDEQLYFTSAFTAPGGMFLSYTTGRLPLDVQDDQVYELGFRYKF